MPYQRRTPISRDRLEPIKQVVDAIPLSLHLGDMHLDPRERRRTLLEPSLHQLEGASYLRSVMLQEFKAHM
jgi:hypothetical protein